MLPFVKKRRANVSGYFCKKKYRKDKTENNGIIYPQRVGVEEQDIFCWLILASQYYRVTYNGKIISKPLKIKRPSKNLIICQTVLGKKEGRGRGKERR